MKKTLYISGLMVLPLLFGAAAYAQDAPTTDNTATSDYVKDVQAGQQQLASDAAARSQSTEVKKAEAIEANIDHETAKIDDQAEVNEDEAGDSRTTDGVKTESEVEHETETKTETKSSTESSTSHESTEKPEVKSAEKSEVED